MSAVKRGVQDPSWSLALFGVEEGTFCEVPCTLANIRRPSLFGDDTFFGTRPLQGIGRKEGEAERADKNVGPHYPLPFFSAREKSHKLIRLHVYVRGCSHRRR